MPVEMGSLSDIDSPGPGGACLSIEPVFRCHESRCARELVIAVTRTSSWPETALFSKESSIHGFANGSNSSDEKGGISSEEVPLLVRPSDAIEGSEEDMSNAKTSDTSLRRTIHGRENHA